jgi:hypothetical protein
VSDDELSRLKAMTEGERFVFSDLRSTSLCLSQALAFFEYGMKPRQVLIVMEGVQKGLPLWQHSDVQQEFEVLLPMCSKFVLARIPRAISISKWPDVLILHLRYEGLEFDDMFFDLVRNSEGMDDYRLANMTSMNDEKAFLKMHFEEVKTAMQVALEDAEEARAQVETKAIDADSEARAFRAEAEIKAAVADAAVEAATERISELEQQATITRKELAEALEHVSEAEATMDLERQAADKRLADLLQSNDEKSAEEFALVADLEAELLKQQTVARDAQHAHSARFAELQEKVLQQREKESADSATLTEMEEQVAEATRHATKLAEQLSAREDAIPRRCQRRMMFAAKFVRMYCKAKETDRRERFSCQHCQAHVNQFFNQLAKEDRLTRKEFELAAKKNKLQAPAHTKLPDVVGSSQSLLAPLPQTPSTRPSTRSTDGKPRRVKSRCKGPFRADPHFAGF